MQRVFIISILTLLYSVQAFAQSSALWKGSTYWTSAANGIEGYYWNTWDDFSYPKGSYGNYICESNGTPLFHNGAVNLICAKDGSKITESDSLVPLMFEDCWYQRNDSVYDLIGFYDSTEDYSYIYTQFSWYGGYLFDSLSTFPSGIYRHTITKTKDGWVCTEKNTLLLEAKKPVYDDLGRAAIQHQFNYINRFTDYSYVLLNREYSVGRNSLDIIKLDNGEMNRTDSLILGSSIPYFEEPLFAPLNNRIYSDLSIYDDVVINRSHTKLFFIANGSVQLDTFDKRMVVASYKGLFEIDIDPVTLNFLGSPKELWKFQENRKPVPYLERKRYNESLSCLEISPNDSILYFNMSKNQADSVDGVLKTNYNTKLCYWRYNEKPFTPEIIRTENATDKEISMSYYMLNPYGKMYFSLDQNPQIIENTNNPSGPSTALKQIAISASAPGLRNYDYVRLDHSIDYTCEAQVSFENKSDLSRGMNSFTWYFTKEDGNIDTIVSFEPTVIYSKNGDYPFKCYGYSPSGIGYGEYYIDTLHIRIPPKPVASFIVSDTIVCAYKSLKFTSTSNADSIHRTKVSKLVWSYGDGITETVNTVDGSGEISHTYETSGTYTVSLFYSNGYCDSTLVKNQYIRVVDAPAPGFSIDNNRGCSPFTVNVTDIVTKNATKKEYNYYDGRGWIDVPVKQADFSVVYPEPGKYWITQRLYGYTGCVTQLDSVRIYVSLGVTQNDTIHMLEGTYTQHPSSEGALVMHSDKREEWRSSRQDSREPIALTWSGHDAAVKYRLSRNGALLADVDTPYFNFTDSVDRPLPFTYTIVAVDSCGTASASGMQISPMYLTGRASDDNSIAVITFSPYTEQLAEQEYTVLTEVNGDWVTLNSLGTNTNYTDEEFLRTSSVPLSGVEEQTRLEKCYRIANQTSQLSNVLCLPYKPVILIPTAFSPNADNLNDLYRPVTFGIEQYQMQIYNRYGQQIADLDQNSAGWDAADAPQGAYMVIIRAKGTDNQWYDIKSTVTVVR